MGKGKNYLKFDENRKLVQKFFASENFIIPVEKGSIKIIEKKNLGKHNLLTNVFINNIPSQELYPISWTINVEKELYIFSAPPHIKKTDEVLLTLVNGRLFVFMIELKNSIANDNTPQGLDAIEKKFKDTMERISILLPINRHSEILKYKNQGEAIYANTKILQMKKRKVQCTGFLKKTQQKR